MGTQAGAIDVRAIWFSQQQGYGSRATQPTNLDKHEFHLILDKYRKQHRCLGVSLVNACDWSLLVCLREVHISYKN